METLALLCYINFMAAISIRYTKPTLTRKDMDAVLQTMVDEKIGPGEKKREFVKLFSAFLGAKDGIALRSLTDVISYSVSALKLEEGATIALSLFTPKIYEIVLKKMGYDLYFTDVDEFGLPKLDDVQSGIESNHVKALIAFLPLGSMYKEIEPLKELGIPLIEDVTESLCSEFGTLKAGMLGDIVLCSFEEDGIISTGGGAIAVSRKDEYIDALKKEAERTRRYNDLPDMNASLGIVQLVKIDSTIERRREIFKAFQQSLQKGEGKSFLSGNINFNPNGFTFPVMIETRLDEAVAFAEKCGIEVRRSFSQSVGNRFQEKYERYPNAVGPIARCLSFPLYPFLRSTDVDTIEKVLRHIG